MENCCIIIYTGAYYIVNMQNAITIKRCSVCKEEKKVEYFPLRREYGKITIRGTCKKCTIKRGNRGRYIRKCPICGKDFLARARNYPTCCSPKCGTQHSIPLKPTYKGGRTITDGGYVKVKAHGHPNAYDNGYILEHRLVMEKVLGRYLKDNERVHHINGLKTDNRPENLQLVKFAHHGHVTCPKCEYEFLIR